MKKGIFLLVSVIFFATGLCHSDQLGKANENNIPWPYVYGRLVKAGGSWSIAPELKMQFQGGSVDGLDFFINTLAPAGVTTASVVITCIPLGDCVEEKAKKRVPFKTREDAIHGLVTPWSGPFYNEKVNVGATVLNNAIGILATVGLGAGITLKTYTFDLDGYNSAIAEAVSNSGFDYARRKYIVDGVASLIERKERYDIAYAAALHETKKEYEKTVVNIKYETQNRSGFRDAEVANGGVSVTVNTRNIAWPSSAGNNDDLVQRFLSSGAVRLDEYLNELDLIQAQRLKKLDEIKKANRSVWFYCSESGAYHVEYRCPSDMDVSPAGSEVRVPIVVKAKMDFRIGLPNLVGSDKVVAFSLSPLGIEITNKTGDFVKVDAISLYWGGKVSTLTNLALDIPPHANIESPIPLTKFDYRFLLANKPMAIKKSTAEELLRLKVSVGLAIKYTQQDKSQIKTLFTEKLFGGVELAEARVPPGWL